MRCLAVVVVCRAVRGLDGDGVVRRDGVVMLAMVVVYKECRIEGLLLPPDAMRTRVGMMKRVKGRKSASA